MSFFNYLFHAMHVLKIVTVIKMEPMVDQLNVIMLRENVTVIPLQIFYNHHHKIKNVPSVRKDFMEHQLNVQVNSEEI